MLCEYTNGYYYTVVPLRKDYILDYGKKHLTYNLKKIEMALRLFRTKIDPKKLNEQEMLMFREASATLNQNLRKMNLDYIRRSLEGRNAREIDFSIAGLLRID